MQKDNSTTSTGDDIRLILVTGASGAGLSTALKILEDCGITAVDNLALALVDQLVALEVEAAGRRVAIGLDARTTGFEAASVQTLVKNLRNRFGDGFKMVFVSAGIDDLRRRFNATRRQHPLGDELSLDEAIAADVERMDAIEPLANLRLDTSGSKPADMRRQLLEGLQFIEATPVPAHVMSFSYRHGLPEGADLVIDMRFADNPHWVDQLRSKTGRDPEIDSFLRADKAAVKVMDAQKIILGTMLDRMSHEGRPLVTIAFGCTGGRHRSVWAGEVIAAWLREKGHPVKLEHRELRG